MTPISPALELVGDWTSARLLIRLLQAIESPWRLGERGLTHEETGETCAVTMRQADPRLAGLFRAGDDPVHPSLTDAVVQAIDGHKAVVKVTPDPAHDGEAATLAVVRCADGLVNAGAIALWCPISGAAHDADRFQERVRELDAVDDPALKREALFHLLVRPLVAGETSWHTSGMGLLGGPDVHCPRDLPDVIALDLLGQVVQGILVGRTPPDGREFRVAGRAEPFVTAHRPDPRRKRDPAHNPFGTVWLSTR